MSRRNRMLSSEWDLPTGNIKKELNKNDKVMFRIERKNFLDADINFLF